MRILCCMLTMLTINKSVDRVQDCDVQVGIDIDQ